MNIAIVGTGYVGLVTGTCFAEMGTNVTCVDIDTEKIDKLNNGIMPIYEPGLEELVKKNVREGRLHFTTDLTSALGKVEIVFSAVGTPPDEDGSADLHYVLDVARTFGHKINRYTLLVTKSTVPVGTAQKVKAAIREELEKRGVNIPFDVASNPEFLKEGAAIKDFMNPDRVVVGVDSQQARTLMERLYKPFLLNGFPILFMDVSSAEMTKYAANCMLATKISFINEIATLCEKVGADVRDVRTGIGSDHRIGYQFIYPGIGYGGSCFPKDVKALIHTAHEAGMRPELLEAVEGVNARQKRSMAFRVADYFEPQGGVFGKVLALWGLAFKANTDDMRESPALSIIEELTSRGMRVRAYDPIAGPNARKLLADNPLVFIEDDQYAICEGSDALLVATEWNQFRNPDFDRIKESLVAPVLFDGRNLYSPSVLGKRGFAYFCVGKK